MNGQAELHDHRVLERLLQTLRGLPRVADQAISDAETDAAPRMARFAAAIDEARDRVYAAERAASASDDENAAQCEDRVEEARAHLKRLEAAADDLRAALGAYRGAARDLRGLDKEVLVGAREFLTGRLDAMAAYLSLRPAGDGATDGNAGQSPSPSISAAPADDLPPLPAGFHWIPVQRIAGREEGEALKWQKVDAEVMEEGMRAFEADLLPRLRHGDASRDTLAAFDRATGRDTGGAIHADSLANLHDVFFGSDPVAVSPLADGGFDLSSGRHRTEIARRLGWSHIPARLLGGG